MSTEPALNGLDYPESDGRPIAESDLHRTWICRLIDM